MIYLEPQKAHKVSLLMYYNFVKVAKKNKVFDEYVDSLTRLCHLERSEKPLAHDPEVGSNLLSANAVGEKAIKDVSLSLNMTSVM